MTVYLNYTHLHTTHFIFRSILDPWEGNAIHFERTDVPTSEGDHLTMVFIVHTARLNPPTRPLFVSVITRSLFVFTSLRDLAHLRRENLQLLHIADQTRARERLALH